MEIQEYNATESGLADIAKRMKDVVYDVTTASGMQTAKLDRRELITLRVNLEATRKELKAPALARSKAIDGEAKRIETRIRELEEPIDAQIKKEEQRIEDAKQEVIFAKREKVRLILERIERIKSVPDRIGHQTAEKIAEAMKIMEDTPIDTESFGEHLEEAQAAYAESMDILKQTYDLRVKEETEAAESEAQRLADIEEDRIKREAAQKILDEEAEKLRLEREAFQKEKDDAQKLIDEAQAVEDEKKRIADAEAAEKARLKAIEDDKACKDAEKAKKAAERKARVAEAKCVSATEAFQKIIELIDAKTPSCEEKLDEIQVIAEANI